MTAIHALRSGSECEQSNDCKMEDGVEIYFYLQQLFLESKVNTLCYFCGLINYVSNKSIFITAVFPLYLSCYIIDFSL